MQSVRGARAWIAGQTIRVRRTKPESATCPLERHRMKILAKRHFPAFCVSLLPALTAADEQAKRAFTKLLSDPVEQQHVISDAGQATVFLQNPCADARFSIEQKYVPYKPISFDSAGSIVAGAWKQIVEEQGCGAARILNVLVIAQGAGKLSFVPLLPGRTHADPVLQRDAVKYAVTALSTVPGGREPNCTVRYVADTEYLGEEGQPLPGVKASPWKELWTFQSCTQKMLVPIRFIPDPTGTTISAGPNTEIQVVSLAR